MKAELELTDKAFQITLKESQWVILFEKNDDYSYDDYYSYPAFWDHENQTLENSYGEPIKNDFCYWSKFPNDLLLK